MSSLVFSDLYEIGSLPLSSDTLYNASIHTRPLIEKNLQVKVRSQPKKKDSFAETNCSPHSLLVCFVSLDTIMNLQLVSGSYINLSNTAGCSVLGRIYVDEAIEADTTIEISPFQAINLEVSNNDTITLGASSCHSRFDIASKASISIIRTSTSMSLNQDTVTKGLHDFFATKKVLKLGEIFPVLVDFGDNKCLDVLDDDDREATEEEVYLSKDSIEDYSQSPNLLVVFFKVQALVDFNGVTRKDYLEIQGFGGKTMLSTVAPCNQSIFHKQLFKTYLTGVEEKDFLYPIDSQEEHLKKLISSIWMLKDSKVMPSMLLLGQDIEYRIDRLCKEADMHGVNIYEVDLFSCRGLGEEKVCAELNSYLEKALSLQPCVLILKRIEVFVSSSNGMEKPEEPNMVLSALKTIIEAKGILLLCTSSKKEDISNLVQSYFTHIFDLKAPTKDLRESYIKLKISKHNIKLANTELEDFNNLTSGKLYSEVDMILDTAKKESCIDQNFTAKPEITISSLKSAIESLPNANSLDISAPKIPKVYWKDIGGLEHAKKEILDMIKLPSLSGNSKLKSRSGILLFGPPGTGKTLLAKAVATECKLNFISVKGPELLDMYIGESERKVRQVFEMARAAKPSILFFDELDSLAPRRGRGADSGGVMDRVVSQLLTEISSEIREVFVIGATNRPDLLDDSLMRPGRFDRMIYLGISKDKQGQLKVIEAVTRKFNIAPDVNFDDLLNTLTSKYGQGTLTGADLAALCNEAMSASLTRKTSQLMEDIKNKPNINMRKYLKSMKDSELVVSVEQGDFLTAINNLVPSVSQDELKHYEHLREKFGNN